MKISGVTIVKNAVEFDYPIVESIKSILPLVDEMIVCIGDGFDETEQLIKSINSSKIKIEYSVWDKNLTNGGSVLANETNKALKFVSKDSDWIFYLQADEVIHEEDYEEINNALIKYKDNKKVEGFLFKYKHFYGTFDYLGDSRKWYNYEIRIVRNNINVQSYRDAQGFRINNRKLNVKRLNAFIYHYGWVRTPNAQLKKIANFDLYYGATELKKIEENDMFDYIKNADSLIKYNGTQPKVMEERIRLRNTKLDIDTTKKNFDLKDLILYKIEKITGVRLFDYKNYKTIN